MKAQTSVGKAFTCRWMLPQDVDGVVEIGRECFEVPWGKRDFIRFLRKCGGLCLVATFGVYPVAYLAYEPLPRELRIHQLAVTVDWRRIGVARKLLLMLLDGHGGTQGLTEGGHCRATAVVGETNLPALKMFRSVNFKAVWTYRHPAEDVLLMRRTCWDN